MNTSLFSAAGDKELILQLLDNVLESINQMDIDRLLSYHSEDVILMEPGLPLIQGKQPIRKLFLNMDNKQPLKLSFNVYEIEVSGNRAFARGQVLKLTTSGDELSSGKFICLFRKQENGSWLRTHVIVNNDHPAHDWTAALR